MGLINLLVIIGILDAIGIISTIVILNRPEWAILPSLKRRSLILLELLDWKKLLIETKIYIIVLYFKTYKKKKWSKY